MVSHAFYPEISALCDSMRATTPLGTPELAHVGSLHMHTQFLWKWSQAWERRLQTLTHAICTLFQTLIH